MNDHKDKNITWMANTIIKVNNDCINSGKHPNGKKLTNEERVKMILENIDCQMILIENDCQTKQLKLF